MKHDICGRLALALAGALAFAGGCSDEPAGTDGSVSDGSVRECSEELFCKDGVVEREYAGEAGRCLRTKIHTCEQGCKMFSATTSQPAFLCREGLPDAKVADRSSPADAAPDDAAVDAPAEGSVPVDAALADAD